MMNPYMKPLFENYEERNYLTSEQLGELREEYYLIQAKKSKLSANQRREVCRILDEQLNKVWLNNSAIAEGDKS